MQVNESHLMIVEDPRNEFSLDQTRNPWIAKHFSGFCFLWFRVKRNYTWESIENLYDQEELAKTYEKWLKTENERLDSHPA
jgi:hypothetical protein